ncbi:hypothetical protein TSOC_004079 [Tetrabaena socialis]|uniref:Uncharacterized protein n=1 Tax=Tetrabaena socialis TaxID=47790 RepID=A0A2J8A9V7_9CHLO|nr:hypothetical protein TSOC_004079 [Tetrabaena socialis]|eukprot:PNH09314.1 hypothetical protein TSOC_004079 [Tetrabaena socialis]
MDDVASRPQPGLAPTAVSDESSTLLEVLVPQLWRLLYRRDRCRLRACSREILRLVDRSTDTLALRWASSEAERDGVVAALRRVLARGCRPRRLELPFYVAECPATKTAFGLRLLAELQALSLLPLKELLLVGLPLTAAVVRAIAMTVPQLSILELHGYTLSHDSPRFIPAPSGVQALLRHGAPHLQQLRLHNTTGLAGSSRLPAAPNGLAPLLLQCSRLESLMLGSSDREPLASYHRVLSALAQLPALRSLELLLPKEHDAGSSLTVLSNLTQLTHLEITADFDLGAVLPAVLGIRGLADLHLPSHQLRPSHMRQLAALTALTRLGAKGIGAAGEPSPEGTAELGTLPAPAPQPLVPLPALLQVLILTDAPSPSDLAALQLPSGPLRLQLPGITIPAADKGADGCLRESAAEALLAACRQLTGRFVEDEDAGASFELRLCSAAPPASWPDGYGTLFAALRAAGILWLAIHDASLTLYDVDALVRHLPLLEVRGVLACAGTGAGDLRLECAVELPSLPLLCRLKRLSGLQLYPGDELVEGWDSQLALRAALLVLCVEAPSLTDLTFHFSEDAQEQMVEAAEEVTDRLSEELPTLRDDPPSVQVERYSVGSTA